MGGWADDMRINVLSRVTFCDAPTHTRTVTQLLATGNPKYAGACTMTRVAEAAVMEQGNPQMYAAARVGSPQVSASPEMVTDVPLEPLEGTMEVAWGKLNDIVNMDCKIAPSSARIETNPEDGVWKKDNISPPISKSAVTKELLANMIACAGTFPMYTASMELPVASMSVP